MSFTPFAVQGGKLFEELCEEDEKGEQKRRLVWCERSLSDDPDFCCITERRGGVVAPLGEVREQLRKIFQREMKKSAEENSKTKRETVLRIGVDGGGCAGFQYTFALIDEKDVVTRRGSSVRRSEVTRRK